MPVTPQMGSSGTIPTEVGKRREVPDFDPRRSELANARLESRVARYKGFDDPLGAREMKDQRSEGGFFNDFGHPGHRESDFNVDAYRALLGIGSGSGPNRGQVDGTTDKYRPSGNVFVPPPPVRGSEVGSLNRGSLQPMRPVDRNLFAPTAPVGPSQPTVFDVFEPDGPLSTGAKPVGSVSKPLYEPPRRKF